MPDGNGSIGGGASGAGLPPSDGALTPIGADLRNALRTRAERIPLRALEKRGFRNVQVLDMATIEKIVGEALTHLLERHTAVLTREDRAKLEAEARSEFGKLLAEHKKVVAEKSESERAREQLERQVQGMREDLARQRSSLQAERARTLGDTFTLSPASFKEMEEKIRALFAHLVSKERRLSLAEAGPRALAGLSELEREVASFLDRLLVGERDRFIGVLKKDQSEKVEILEKRIEKLNRALSETEQALRRVAEAKAGDPGIASIYDSIQGLSSLDLNFEKKKELLTLIFEENLVIQKRTAGGGAPAAPEAAGRLWSLPPGFEPPLDPVTDETAF